jgi:hypothetical protein
LGTADPEAIQALSLQRGVEVCTVLEKPMAEHFVDCPFCTADTAELVSLFGSQLLLSQYRCTTCGSYFEGVRQDRWEIEPVAPASGGRDDDGNRSEY